MTEGPADGPGASSTRADYPSMARLAAALYAKGFRPSEVLGQCYGVEFPDEFWVVARQRRTRPRLLATFTNQPWELAVPPSQGGTDPSPNGLTEGIEQDLFARDPDLLPLVHLPTPRTTLVDTVVCYRISELRAGSTEIFGIKAVIDRDPVMDPEPDPDPEVVRLGDSLLDVLHRHHVDDLHNQEQALNDPANWGFGAVSEQSVAEVRSLVERIEAMRREVADRQDAR